MERPALKLLLMKAGEDPYTIDSIVWDPRYRGMAAEEALVSAGVISEQRLAELMSAHLGIPLIRLEERQVDPHCVQLLHLEAAINYSAMPYRREGDVLLLAMADPEDSVAAKAIEFLTGLQTRPVMALRSDIMTLLGRFHPSARGQFCSPLESMVVRLFSPAAQEARFEADDPVEKTTPAAVVQHATLVRLTSSVVVEAIRMRATDIHIEPHGEQFRIRYRIDGQLQTVTVLPMTLLGALLSHLKALAHLAETSPRTAQEGRCRVTLGDTRVGLRLNILPTVNGERAVLRLQDDVKVRTDFESLGMTDQQSVQFGRLLDCTQGVVLVAGPGGSGGTSTLYAALARLDRPQANLATLECPVEHHVPDLNQVQVDLSHGMTWLSALHAVLRQDPDVLLIGELADRDMARAAFRAAESGRFILSCVPCKSSLSALNWLADLGLSSTQVAASLSCVMAQRLVRRLCLACRTETAAAGEGLEMLRTLGLSPPSAAYASTGCQECNYLGYRGRVGIFEILEITDRLRDLLYRGAPLRDVLSVARQEGLTTLMEDGLDKVAQGLTSLDELRRVLVPHASGGIRCPGCARGVEADFQVCPHCGEAWTINCPSCERPIETGWKTCPYCRVGLELAPRQTVAAPASPPLSPPSTIDDANPDPSDWLTRAATHDPGGDLILLVEDDLTQGEVIRACLEEDGGYRVTIANNGQRALQLAHSLRPALILSDMNMPGMDGLELVQQVRGDFRTALIPVILMTTASEAETELRAFAAGADDYLRKPIEVDRWLARVGAVLKRTGVRV
ncbi:MAG TPA: ATPase, T2SS/T4P/T4SS family [Candidatus Xenobia bacterium]